MRSKRQLGNLFAWLSSLKFKKILWVAFAVRPQLLEKELNGTRTKRILRRWFVDQFRSRLCSLVDRLLVVQFPCTNWSDQYSLKLLKKCGVSYLRRLRCRILAIERDYDPIIPDLYVDPDMLPTALLNIAREISMQGIDIRRKTKNAIVLKASKNRVLKAVSYQRQTLWGCVR